MSTQTQKQEPLRHTILGARLSFPSLDKAKANEQGGDAKFECTLILDKKDHAKDIATLEKLIQRATMDTFGTLKIKFAHELLRDGGDKEEMDGYGVGVKFLKARSGNRPAVVDGAKSPVAPGDAKWPYAGCYVNVGIDIYGYNNKAKGAKGVSASLRWVQFAKDGEPFGGGRVDMDEIPEVAADNDGL